MTIEPGPYMLARRVFCFDEINEMQKDDAKYIGECLENGECHIAKAMNALVKTDAALLGACNPDKGSFKTDQDAKPLENQVSIPEAILSRFDLKIIMRDIQSEERDREIAEFMSEQYLPDGDCVLGEFISAEWLRKYLVVADTVIPVATRESNKVLDDYFVRIRKEFSNSDNMKVTKRQHRALHLLSEAHAKVRLSETVDVQDAQAAVDLFDMCLRNLDISAAISGDPVSRKTKGSLPQLIIQAITDISGGTNGTRKASEMSVVTALKKQGYQESKIMETIQQMKITGTLMEPTNGLLKVV